MEKKAKAKYSKIIIISISLILIPFFIIIAYQNDIFSTVEKIELSSSPNSTEVVEGISPDFEGLAVVATYENGKTKEITYNKLAYENYDPNFIGTQNVIVKYKDKTTNIDITTREKKLISITIKKEPDMKEYIQGMNLNIEGLIVEGVYDNGTKQVVDNNNLLIQDYNKEIIGTQRISVACGNKKESFEVNVKPKKLLEITMKKAPNKTTYPEGTQLDLSGIEIIANYDNNIPEQIQRENLTVSGYKSNALGEQTITISYKNFSLTFNVIVEKKKATGIEITAKPKKISYLEGQNFDTTGLKVSKVYDNGHKENIDTEKLTISGYNPNSIGKQSIKVSFETYKTSFSVTVNLPEPEVITVSNPSIQTVLVNKTYALPSNYRPSNLVKVNIPVAYKHNDANRLKKPAADALFNLYMAAKKEGLEIVARSGYRSYSTQKTIYNNNIKKKGIKYTSKYSAKPGHSEHQTGLAMDVTCSAVNNKLRTSFGDTKEGKWVKANAHKYGFIIRYPKGKEKITGYSYEPWHLRYLGVDTATKVYNSGLTLEEYFGVK